MTIFESQAEISNHRPAKFFLPSLAEISLYFLLAIILLTVFNLGKIFQKLSNTYAGSPEKLQTNFSALAQAFNHSFSAALGGRLGQIILWSFIGAVAYIGLWLGKNLLNSFENDIISDHYLHPSNYNRAGYWSSSIAVKIFLLALLLVSAGYIYIVASAVLPSVSSLAASALFNYESRTSLFYLVFAVCGTAIIIYLAAVLSKLLVHLWKLL